MKGDLDISIFGNELDIFVKHPQDTSGNTLEGFVNWIFFITDLFVLVNYVFKNDSDEGNNCDQERSHRNRSTMVPHSPFDSFANTHTVRRI